MGEIVFSVSLVDVVVVAGGQFLGSVRVGSMGRSIAVLFCYGDVLLGKRVIV